MCYLQLKVTFVPDQNPFPLYLCSIKQYTMINKIKNILGLGPKVDYKELIAGGALIIDVRTKGEFEGGHAEGSINIPLDQLNSAIKKLKNKEKTIITCCASGMRSESAKSILIKVGFEKVYNAGSWYNLK